MDNKWKLEKGIFYAFINQDWLIAKARDVYCSAFGGSADKSGIASKVETIREAFPDIHFSRFSVSPKLKLYLENEKIQVSVFFSKAGKDYYIDLPTPECVDYSIVDNKWHYYSGDYYQIIDVLSSVNVSSSEISFIQYIDIIKKLENYPELLVIDSVKTDLPTAIKDDSNYQPVELKATLYPYQKVGFRWLKYITEDGCGCILGDEMGLGKTIQVISLLVDRHNNIQNPSLVVAPLSLLENWRRELEKFAPCLSVAVHHGSKRTGRYKDLLNYDVIITSYGTTITDLSLFEMINWDLLILDEAQNIKNPYASRTVSIKQIPHRASIAVTGTPFENHMTDLWSLLDFTIPGCLGSLQEFNVTYSDDYYGAEKIEPILTALMLRRRVSEVADDLPDKIIIPQAISMDNTEALLYEDERQNLMSSNKGGAVTLAMLTKLRMFCTHPFLVRDSFSSSDPVKHSTKYRRFCELVEEIVEQEEKVIVFTSYSDMFTIMKNDISFRFNIPVECINGSTPAEERQKIVDSFSEKKGPAMLILNPRAAGTGLNITAANHVIHYNLEWNPAIEDQATARAHRRGQEKTVFVYRLYYANTVEEVVNQKIANKRDMSDVAVVGSEGTEDVRTLLMQALNMSPIKE